MKIKPWYVIRRPDDGEGSELTGGDAVGTGNDARVAMLERINDENDALRADELADVNDDGTTNEFHAQNLTPSDDDGVTQRELDRLAAEVNEDPPEPAAPRFITRKVNGKDMTLTEDQWFDRASKVEAADQYLNEAARMRQEAERLYNQNQNQVPPVKDVPDDDVESLRARVRALQMGSEDEAMAALKPLISPRAPQFSQEDLARVFDERLTFKEAIGKFETEYSDILADPQLRALTIQRDQQLLAQGDKRGYYERYAEIGNGIRNWRDQLVKSAAPQTNPLQEKAAAKADAASRSVPRSTNNKAKPAAVDDDQQESASDIIANIAKARGGPQWSRA